ncbi:MAG: type II toxin-antitoxin system death-on-curing family toxin [Cyanobacteria bacterium M_surface_10_m2_179]|nr:type II toxin-antitoxin system death-on-curing family toxin [Cyanobacteria bacterium M_surface_10_m2_179]
MRWLTLAEILELHRQLIEQSGGSPGIRDLGLLEASLAQPWQTFGGVDLYPEFLQKVACLGFSLIQNHPFVDGNKRIGHAAMEVVMVLNGLELLVDVDQSESVVLRIATGGLDRQCLAEWLDAHQSSDSSESTMSQS